MKLDELYFGVKLFQMSYSSEKERTNFKTYNLFDFGRVKSSVAIYRSMTPEQRENVTSPLHFCFGDVWGRTEFEFVACPWPYQDGEKIEENGIKIDTFSLYVEPNADYLMSLVEQVDVADCKKYLKEWRKRYKR